MIIWLAVCIWCGVGVVWCFCRLWVLIRPLHVLHLDGLVLRCCCLLLVCDLVYVAIAYCVFGCSC